MVNLDLDSLKSSIGVPDRFKRSWHSIRERFQAASVPLISGSITYTAFNLHVCINGGLARICSWCGPVFTSAFLLNSHVCTGIYLYRQNLFRTWSERRKFLYTCYVTVMFNFGSILFVAATKSYLPNSNLLRGLYSILASFGLICIGLDLMSQADKKYITPKF